MNCSLVIPVYNEAPIIVATLRALHEEFLRHDAYTWEVLVVDNGSTDNIADAMSSAAIPNVRLLHMSEKGKGRALRMGFSEAKGSIVGFTDADLSVPPEEIVNAFALVEKNMAQPVIGSRFHPQSTLPGREWWRTGSSSIFNMLARTILGVHAGDTQCPLKVMGREDVRILLATKEDTWFLDLELIALFESLRIPFVEVPVTWDEHRYPARLSKLSTTRDGLRAIVAMFRIKQRLPAQVSLLA